MKSTDLLQFLNPTQGTVFCPFPGGHHRPIRTDSRSAISWEAEAYGLLRKVIMREGQTIIEGAPPDYW